MADTERIDEPDRTEEGMSRPAEQPAEQEWEENEPSPHEGEAGQQESEA
ncbi:MAG TPA: hypothetical protein VG144_09530 [Gaiellaceae bacterium]|nr:hypothetical protein [Gaiellaceae bacterium]